MKMTLKHFARISGFALSTLLLIQCDTSKEPIEPAKPTQFDLPEMMVEFPDFEGMNTTKVLVSEDGVVKCSTEDQLKVFVETVGQTVTDWESVAHNYITTEEDLANGIFKPENPLVLDELDSKINLYVMNPNSEMILDPMGGEDSTSEINLDGQMQNYNDITAHLKNYTFMTGVAENIGAGQTPKIKLEHKTALLKFTIDNQLRKNLTLQTVDIAVPEGVNISGSYRVNFNSGAPLVPVEAKNVAKLTLFNAPELSANASTDVFIMTPAFSLKKGQVVRLTINSDQGMWEKIITVPEDVEIKAGSLNTIEIEKNSYVAERIWSKTHTEMNLKTVNASGVTINNDNILIQEYNGRCHFYDRLTGNYIKETYQGGNISFMLGATTDDANHFITSRENIYGAGFIVYRYLDGNEHQLILNCPAAKCTPNLGQRIRVCGDVTIGKAYIYTTGMNSQSIYCWPMNDGQLLVPEDDPSIIEYTPAGKPCDYISVQRASLSDDSEHYVSFIQADASDPSIGGSKFQIVDKNMNVVAELNPANHMYRILDFKVFKIGQKTILAILEQGFFKYEANRVQFFDITDRENMKLKPGDAGYEKLWLYTSPFFGVTNFMQWGNVSVSVDEAKKEALIVTSSVGGAQDGQEPTNISLFRLKLD